MRGYREAGLEDGDAAAHGNRDPGTPERGGSDGNGRGRPEAPEDGGRTERESSGADGNGRRRPGAPEDGDLIGPDGGDPAGLAVRPVEVEETFERTIAEGKRRLYRPWAPLVATGLVGGTDVGTGVLAFLLVLHATGTGEASHLLAGLAFSIGLVALTLARSELFTENFLVPVITVVVRQARPVSLARLWTVTLAANLAAGWLITGLIMVGFPQLDRVAVQSGADYAGLGIGWRSFALALMGGAAITLMTWMQHAADSYGIKLIPAVTTGFLLVGGGLNHTVISSLLSFAGLHTGVSPYGYLGWAESAGWAALGNIIGGVALVTLLRLLQVPHRVRGERATPAPEVSARAGGHRRKSHV